MNRAYIKRSPDLVGCVNTFLIFNASYN